MSEIKKITEGITKQANINSSQEKKAAGTNNMINEQLTTDQIASLPFMMVSQVINMKKIQKTDSKISAMEKADVRGLIRSAAKAAFNDKMDKVKSSNLNDEEKKQLELKAIIARARAVKEAQEGLGVA